MLSSTLRRLSPLIVLAAGLATCWACDDPADEKEGILADDPFAIAFVDAHNQVREDAQPAPSPALPALSWDSALSVLAKNWADGCLFEHSQGDTGENLAFHTDPDTTPETIVGLWAAEVAGYDYTNNACTAEPCGHYTQIVWRNSEKIGCAVTKCDKVKSIDSEPAGLVFVCEYDPPGNFIGERPY